MAVVDARGREGQRKFISRRLMFGLFSWAIRSELQHGRRWLPVRLTNSHARARPAIPLASSFARMASKKSGAVAGLAVHPAVAFASGTAKFTFAVTDPASLDS